MNQTNFKSHALQALKIIVLAVVLAVGTQYVSAVNWEAPAGSPPNNNKSAPINVGGDGQTKTGGVTLGAGLTSTGLALNVPFGNVQFKLNDSNPTGKYLRAKDSSGALEWTTGGPGGGSVSAGLFYTRSAESQNDKIQWCPSTHPILISCSTVAGTAPDSVDDLTAECPNNGSCDAYDLTPRRTDLGGNDVYFETVYKTVGSGFVYGCLAYDKDHQHRPYHIDIICAN